MARCIVTGGAGFIGSHLVGRLLGDGHEVLVLDDCSTGRLQNLAHLWEKDGLEIVETDIADTAAIAGHFHGGDRVFHLAALADIVPSIERPLDYHRANVQGTISVLEAARAAGAARLVYAASSSCYGLPEVFPTPEDAPIRPQYPYALTKWLAEEYVLSWCRYYGLPALSLRLFNVYGPRSRTSGTYGAVFGVFLAQKRAGQPLTVVGDGSQTRDFTFVTDVVEAFARAADSDLCGEVFNVGTGESQSVNRLVELLDAPCVHIPRRPGEPDCTRADISKIRRALDWEPRVGFAQGVGVMLDHIDDWCDAPVWNPDTIAAATRQWFESLGDGSTR